MRRHELDPISLIFGFAFTGLGVLFLIGQADQALRLRWVWPILLLALGAAILLDVTRSRPTDDPAPEVADEVGPTPALEPALAEDETDPEPGLAVESREHPR